MVVFFASVQIKKDNSGTLIRPSIVRHLIWVCAVCLYRLTKTIWGLYGINRFHSYKFSDVTTEDITFFSQLVRQKSKVKRELIKAEITWNYTNSWCKDFEEANSQINSLCRYDLRMQKCRKSDIFFDLEKKVHLLRSCTKIYVADEMFGLFAC